MFGNDSKIQLAVLQERFKAHEQIIEKVDTAIQTLSETNQNICKMLTVHDERINAQKEVDSNITTRVSNIEKKLEGLSKFKWQAGAIVAFVVILIGIINAFGPKLLTPQQQGVRLERTK
jgi:DNA repair ATPase RecN